MTSIAFPYMNISVACEEEISASTIREYSIRSINGYQEKIQLFMLAIYHAVLCHRLLCSIYFNMFRAHDMVIFIKQSEQSNSELFICIRNKFGQLLIKKNVDKLGPAFFHRCINNHVFHRVEALSQTLTQHDPSNILECLQTAWCNTVRENYSAPILLDRVEQRRKQYLTQQNPSTQQSLLFQTCIEHLMKGELYINNILIHDSVDMKDGISRIYQQYPPVNYNEEERNLTNNNQMNLMLLDETTKRATIAFVMQHIVLMSQEMQQIFLLKFNQEAEKLEGRAWLTSVYNTFFAKEENVTQTEIKNGDKLGPVTNDGLHKNPYQNLSKKTQNEAFKETLLNCCPTPSTLSHVQSFPCETHMDINIHQQKIHCKQTRHNFLTVSAQGKHNIALLSVEEQKTFRWMKGDELHVYTYIRFCSKYTFSPLLNE